MNNQNNNACTMFALPVKEIIQDGVYPARCENIQLLVGLPKRDGSTFDKVQWNFTLKERNDFFVHGDTSTIVSPNSKAMEWTRAIIGRDLEKQENLTPNTVRGKDCQVVLVSQEYKRKDGTMGTALKVTKVLPA